jgi:HAD superfamily hydrolase (TIGR01549 family)
MPAISGIKNIIFDLGGVLLNLNYDHTRKGFEQLGVENFDTIYSQAQQSNVFDLYETGKARDAEFIAAMRVFLPAGTPDAKIIAAWNAMLLDFPAERMKLLQEVKNQYRIFLLSNTNEIHIRAFEQIIDRQYGLKGLETLFEQTYYSSRVGLRKPNAEIFEYVLKQNQLDRNETIFFDDSIQHIKGAQSIGLKAIFVQHPRTILDFFDPSYQIIEP